ncbi:phosphatase PAP2 family protein [Arthrobacter sp. 35W]|uniref:phosphatase PAP2 family protein n=1 Tax=Arthrobacter sp. 35W TaxID=1132441 RepID=UPI0004299E35|nr:phosphatase PAP2 family protein [Arthrobacter sp. 35W]
MAALQQQPAPGNGRLRAQWVGAAAAAAVIGIMMLALLPAPAAPFFQGIDRWWHAATVAPAGYEPNGLVAFLDAFGRPPGLLVLPVLLAILMFARRWWAALFTVLCYTVPMVLAQVVKNVVDRPRPANPLVIVDHGSFPSGHVVSTTAFVIMVAVLLAPSVRRWWWPAGIVFVAVMMWSRTFLGAHWLSDTVAGAVLGAGATLALWWLFAPLVARDEARRTGRRIRRHPSPALFEPSTTKDLLP